MTASAPPKPKTPRILRGEADVSWQDFNDRPSPARVAPHKVTREALGVLFGRLESADDALTRDRKNPRAAVLEALSSVVEFAATTPHGDGGRFSRALELLRDDLRTFPPAVEAGEIFPPVPGWSERQKASRTVQGSAIYAMELLRQGDGSRGKVPAKKAAHTVAEALDARRFPFAGGRTDKDAAVVAWAKGKVAESALAERDRLRAAKPVALTEDPDANKRAVVEWLEGVLDGARYERVS